MASMRPGPASRPAGTCPRARRPSIRCRAAARRLIAFFSSTPSAAIRSTYPVPFGSCTAFDTAMVRSDMKRS